MSKIQFIKYITNFILGAVDANQISILEIDLLIFYSKLLAMSSGLASLSFSDVLRDYDKFDTLRRVFEQLSLNLQGIFNDTMSIFENAIKLKKELAKDAT